MKKKLIRILIIVGILVAVIGTIIYRISKHIRYNDTYVNGNTAGNLYNAGLFCENNGTVFFANPDDHNRLYSMDSNGKNLKKLNNDSVMYINADSNYVYYVRNNTKDNVDYSFFSYNNNSLCRVSRSGGDAAILDEAPCIYASLLGNYIYYLHYDTETATTLYRVKIDGKELKQVFPYYVFNCSTLGEYFYYNGMQNDSNVYQYDTSNGTDSLYYSCNAYKPIVTDDSDLFYMDVDNNYALVHANPNSKEPDTLTTDSLDCYNVYGSYIFYQKYSKKDPAFCMIKNDGSEKKELASGTYTNINITSYYIYFRDYYSGETFYTSTNKPGEINAFHPGVIEDK